MKPQLPHKSLNRFKTGLLVLIGSSKLLACGPDFPNSYLGLPTEAILAAPEGFFAVEIARLVPEARRLIPSDETKDDSREADELRAVLIERGEADSLVNQLVSAYSGYRSLQKAKPDCCSDAAQALKLPEGLPLEFSLYLTGATAWYANDVEGARRAWMSVLALPATERRYRSTWAAYMLGRSAAESFPPDEAQRWFRETRDFAQAGFADSLNLAGASYGIEARWSMALQDYGRAISLYLDQYQTGDETAYLSLRMAAAAAAKSDEKQKYEIASEPRARCVVTAWFLARFNSSYAENFNSTGLCEWTEALVKAGVSDLESADRMAWLAYEAGEFELAKTWARLALNSSPETHWIRAKLALRENQLAEGAEELARTACSPNLAAIYRSVVLGELGRVQLALDRREAALATWLDGEHWEDAAYVAERLLTIDELKIFCANHQPAFMPVYEPYNGEMIGPEIVEKRSEGYAGGWGSTDQSLAIQLSQLLARRLVRVGRVEEARVYFSAKNRATLIAYVEAVKIGFNSMITAKKRAKAFWQAAQLVREEGMELMGAELGPDFAIWGGSFGGYRNMEEQRIAGADLFSATKQELDRLKNITVPEKRFSYRYRAADLAWWAASLLPNDSDETAAILQTAGGWIKSRDPMEANRFYQALVIRCGRTKLGKAAAELHWFPSDI